MQEALIYAARGWLVVPLHNPKHAICSCRKKSCNSPGKHPRTEHGLKDGSKNHEQIARWWEKWPDANLGILTGQASGLVVLDVDGEEGKASLQALTAAHGALPKTLCVKTGRAGSDGKRKGCHYYFRAPAQLLRNSAGVLGKGLDIRAEGGYVVAPPSLHPSGLLYEWLAPEQPLADMPSWLLAKLTAMKPVAEAATLDSKTIAEGGRNAALASLAGSMRRRGLAADAIEAALLKHNQGYCSPPLDDAEVHEIACSVSRYTPAPPLPVADKSAAPAKVASRAWSAPLSGSALFGLAGEFVNLVLPHTEADPAALIFQFLAAMGSIIGRGPHVSIGSQKHFAILFLVVVGKSSKARKGTSWSEVLRACELTDLRWTKTRNMCGLPVVKD